jgi:hypothetical protein
MRTFLKFENKLFNKVHSQLADYDKFIVGILKEFEIKSRSIKTLFSETQKSET